MNNKIAIITTHPIQYYAPIFVKLNKEPGLSLMVFYTWEFNASKFDIGFGKEVEWDIPLLEGYECSFVSNEGRMGRGFWDIRNPGLNDAICEWGATAVLVIGWNYLSHLRSMRYFKNRIPVLFRGDSNLLDERPGLKTFLRRNWLRYIYHHIDHALYVGEANRQYFIKHGMKEKQLTFSPHAIDNHRFRSVSDDQLQFIGDTRASLGITETDISILYCGKLIPKKNPQLLLAAFRELDDPHLHLVIVGNGELEMELRHIAAGNSRVHFLPFQNQSLMPAIYRLADIFCLPSKGPGETWGLAVNEAMACGKAVLVSDRVGSAADLVEQGVNGFTFLSNNIEDLVTKIKLMISDRDDLQKMGAASYAKIASWNFEAIVTSIKKALDTR